MNNFRFFTFLSLLFFLPVVYAQEFPPKGLTEKEKEVYEEYIGTFEYGIFTFSPELPPRAPAEFEEVGGVVLTWARYGEELREIVRHARKRVEVYIITDDPSQVQDYLEKGHVPLENITFIDDFPYNSVWVRDYGPQSVYLEGNDELAYIDWVYNRPHRPDDNYIPYNLANYFDLPVFQITSEPNKLVHTGGNLMFDGHGRAFSSKLVLEENSSLTEEQIDDIMYDFMGIETYIKMDELPYDNISHLDMHMKLLDEETLLVGEFPEGVSDGPYIEANLQYLLDNYQTAYGRDFEVVRIPMVPSKNDQYPPDAAYRTYTNSLILNDLVLVPQYHDVALNAEALDIYEEAMPGYEIVGINMENVIGASGAIHCISRELAATDPVFIAHASILEAAHSTPITIEAEIHNAAGITDAEVYWSNDGNDSFRKEDMIFDGDSFIADIPAQVCDTEISYYIKAENSNGKSITKPLVAPEGTYTFTITGDDDDVDFIVDKDSAMLNEPVKFTYSGCKDEYENVEWDFGEGAIPASASTIGPHEVYYETDGDKTVTFVLDDNTVTKEDIVSVTDLMAFELVVQKEGKGQTSPEAGTYYYEEGSEVELDANPETGWEFVSWDIEGATIAKGKNQVSIIVNNDASATAIFEEKETIAPLLTSNSSFNLYPNPSDGVFNIEMTPSEGPVNITVSDLQGRLLYQNTISYDQWGEKYTINLNRALSGIYLVRITCSQNTEVKKIIIN